MTYYLLREQDGEGCDYMIDCGKSIIKLKATTIEEARVEMRGHVEPYYDAEEYTPKCHAENEGVLKSARIVSFVEEIDMNAIYNEYMAIAAQHQKEKKLDKEKEEFERLKEKFG